MSVEAGKHASFGTCGPPCTKSHWDVEVGGARGSEEMRSAKLVDVRQRFLVGGGRPFIVDVDPDRRSLLRVERWFISKARRESRVL